MDHHGNRSMKASYPTCFTMKMRTFKEDKSGEKRFSEAKEHADRGCVPPGSELMRTKLNSSKSKQLE